MFNTPHNDLIPDPRNEWAFRDEIAKFFHRIAEMFSTQRRNEPTIQQVREHLVRGVELALLDAQAEEERYRYTVLMLTERLRRLNHGTSDPVAGLSEVFGAGATQNLRGRSRHDGGVPVPAGGPTLAEPEVALGESHCGGVGPLQLQKQGGHIIAEREWGTLR